MLRQFRIAHLPRTRRAPFDYRLRWLMVGTSLIAMAILGAAVVLLTQMRQSVVVEVQTSLLRQSLSLSELVDQTFRSVDLVLLSVVEKISREMSPTHDLE